jgi:hypothetical protein
MKKDMNRETGERMIEYDEICIIKIENINRELSPYQKCRLVEEERKYAKEETSL